MIENGYAQLTDSELEHERHFSMEFNIHGDTNLFFWEGEKKDNKPFNPDINRYYMAHSNEVSLYASLIGYCVRIGLDEDGIKDMFFAASNEILQDASTSQLRHRLGSHVLWITQGEQTTYYDVPEYGWSNILPPVPVAPGSDVRGGTAVYVAQNGSLVIARVPYKDLTDPAENLDQYAPTYLTPADVPTIAAVISRVALGESRMGLRQLIDERFSISE